MFRERVRPDAGRDVRLRLMPHDRLEPTPNPIARRCPGDSAGLLGLRVVAALARDAFAKDGRRVDLWRERFDVLWS